MNNQIMTTFYTAFSQKDYATMASCYHNDAVFQDPVFGTLQRAEAAAMWSMLLRRSTDLTITFSNIQAEGENGSVHWIATYTFSRTGKTIVNKVHAVFEFKAGKIIKHTDYFDLNKWFVQAFGWKGYFFILLPFLRKKFQQQAKQLLRDYMTRS